MNALALNLGASGMSPSRLGSPLVHLATGCAGPHFELSTEDAECRVGLLGHSSHSRDAASGADLPGRGGGGGFRDGKAPLQLGAARLQRLHPLRQCGHRLPDRKLIEELDDV